jgi:hypothetical protein
MPFWWPSLETWETLGKLAPIATALIALTAVGVAYRALRVQRDVARKRAALDVFFKTEMDSAIVGAFRDYENAIDGFDPTKTTIDEFADTPEYRSIRSYLNIHELIAVGIHNGVLDDGVCFEYWGDEILNAWPDCGLVIAHARTYKRGSPLTYIDLERLYKEWCKRQDRKMRKIARRGA